MADERRREVRAQQALIEKKHAELAERVRAERASHQGSVSSSRLSTQIQRQQDLCSKRVQRFQEVFNRLEHADEEYEQYVNSERKRQFSKELRVEENRMQNVHQKLKSREISRVAEDLRLEGTRLRQMLFELEFDKYTRQLLEYRRDRLEAAKLRAEDALAHKLARVQCSERPPSRSQRVQKRQIADEQWRDALETELQHKYSMMGHKELERDAALVQLRELTRVSEKQRDAWRQRRSADSFARTNSYAQLYDRVMFVNKHRPKESDFKSF